MSGATSASQSVILGRLRRAALVSLCFATTAFGEATAPASAPAATPLNGDQVIVPNSSLTTKAPSGPASTGSGAMTMIGVLGLAAAGGWMLWRGRAGNLKQFSRAPRLLAVEETRSLGNRQFLVVASYQEKKFLIGVCPGRIDLLSPLDSAPLTEAPKARS
jgi:flagellar protein FliO/FliZ